MGRKSAAAFVFLRKIIFSHGNDISASIHCNRLLEQLVGKLQYHTKVVSSTSSNSIQRRHTAPSKSQFLNFIDTRSSLHIPTYATECRQYTTDPMAASQQNVIHDTKNNVFFIDLPGDGSSKSKKGYKAKLDYSWTSPTLVNMHHTEVPPQFQGKGIAKFLAKAAFDYFSENGFTMTPTCTYLQKYLKENPIPKYMDHVEESFKQ